MRSDITRQSFVSAATLFVMLAVLFVCRALIRPLSAELSLPSGVALGGMVGQWLEPRQWLAVVLFVILLVVNAVGITRIVTRNMVLVVRTFLPMIFFLLLSCGIYVTPTNINPMLAAYCFIGGSSCFIASFRRIGGFDLLFRGALFIGIMPLFCPGTVVLWLSIPVALLLFRRSWREGAVALASLLLPVLVYSYITWMTGGEFLQTANEIGSYLITPARHSLIPVEYWRIVPVALMAVTFILSLWTYATTARSMRTRPSRIYLYFLVMAAFSFSMFLLPCRSVEILQFTAICSAVILPTFFVKHTGLFPALLYMTLILSSVIVNFISFI